MSYEPVQMLTGEDWLFRPVLRGLLRAESLIDGTVDLAYVAVLNDACDVEDENNRRARDAAPRQP